MTKLGFIGVGNMGYPMLKGALKILPCSDILISTKTLRTMEKVKEETGVEFVTDKTNLVSECKYIIMAVKPQFYEEVFQQIKDTLTKDHVVITVAPGITTADVKHMTSDDIRVVRSMPNTPALVGEGMSGVCYSADEFGDEERKFIGELFDSFGKYEEFEERLMDAVVCANGSSPAYVYMFIEALADSVVKYGIPRDKAYRLVAQTVLGSAKMVLETKEHPGQLKDKVCSPGGTTIAGVAALEEYGFRNAVIQATDHCYEKAVSFKK